ncbi:putative COPI associated protein [Monocercomonoides exilis]|uniref:putative COPI associated protein n=1 Tax=Monocercomonoides exilis TaxID=2049356 RepID=UPI003559B172|nr:putative COPI associated protein [Monocercomonoides exilis]|eukprot:MONOS_14147.1-p1 / transcript=MONOS_14147.1 / gene=MONOS_14147 / organism=Monocercomonoides_exilis_PA203 / gene_product=unspecified product / transcript_product=unspecified product / location=Mono_scaffold00946:4618-5746(+) / protein_length=274 / sequence_SO=supercontig / SO=protein_coding / is_pseudo=false
MDSSQQDVTPLESMSAEVEDRSTAGTIPQTGQSTVEVHLRPPPDVPVQSSPANPSQPPPIPVTQPPANLYTQQQVQQNQMQVSQRPQQQQKQNSKGCYDNCKSCWTSKAMKILSKIASFFIGIVLIVVSGLLSFILMIVTKAYMFPYVIFSVYCIVFGAVLILVETRINIFVKTFLFIYSYYHRAFFIIFTGTLSMICFRSMQKYHWCGYLSGAVIIVLGVVYLVVGCCDDGYRLEQQRLYMENVGIKANIQSSTSQNNAVPMSNAPLESQSSM